MERRKANKAGRGEMSFKSSITVAIISLSLPVLGECAASLERDATYIQKRYVNGDNVALECKASRKGKCELTILSGKRKTIIEIDFQKAGFEPQLDSIQLFSQSRTQSEFAVAAGVRCMQADEDLLRGKSIEAANCYAEFHVNGGKVTWTSVHISPISDINIYRDIEVPPREAR
jgi:hypothetical protein